MNKLSLIIIICLLLSIPIILWGQIDDLWMLDDMFNEDVGAEITFKTLELYWSTDSYVPFGYQGRALPAKGSLVTVEADLKISGENPKNLKYSWFLDGFFQEIKSGYGRDSFKFTAQKFSGASHIVLVKVFNESRTFLEEKSITIPIIDPEMIVYSKETSQLNLPYTASTETFKVISGRETSFLALPYFFNIEALADLEFEWTLGDKSVKDSSQMANIFGLKIINKKAEGSLEETFRVIATNKKQSDQRVQKIIKINIY